MLKAEIDAGRPVLYSGQSTSAGGHAWVCDGYNSSNFMHFNFGWSGYSDGYYSVDVVNPLVGTGGGGGNFNADQTIIVGIVPDTYPAAGTGNVKMLSHVDIKTNSPMQYMSSFNVTSKILNGNTSSFSGDFCAQAFDTLNNVIGTIQTLTGKTIAAGDSTASLTFSTSGIIGMIPGHFGIRIMYRPSGSSTWAAVADNGNFINYNQMAVVNSQNMKLFDSVAVGSHVRGHGQPLTINTKIINSGSTFSGTVQAVLQNIYTGTSYVIQSLTGQNITGGGGVKNFTFNTSSISAPGGTYVLSVQHQPGASGSFITTGSDYYQNPIMFTIIGGTGVNDVTLTDEDVAVYPNPATDNVHIVLNSTKVDNVKILDMQGREMAAFSDVDKTLTVSVKDYPAGVYLIQLQSGGAMVTKKMVIAK